MLEKILLCLVLKCRAELYMYLQACLKFLREIHLAAQDVASNRFDPPNALWTIYSETSPTFLKVHF